MVRSNSSYLLVVVLLFGARVSPSLAGPDVIVGDLYSLTDYARLGDTAALAVGTVSCNAGDQELNWYQLPDNRHPVIGQNFYRLKDGRLQQLGQAWLKHGFTALQQTTCYSDCQSSGTGTRLGVHCSDPYGPSLNSGPDLGPRSEVNPVIGYYNGSTANNHSGHTHTAISHGLQVKHADLGNAGALYFIEGQYIAPDDATSGNGNNNASYRQYTVTGNSSNWTFTAVGSTVREQPAINVWPGATFTTLDSWPVDGRIIVATKVTPLGGTLHRYDYAVYNMNGERGIRSFSVPVGAATISNIGFSAPLSHDEGFSNAAWASSNSGGNLTWSTDTYATDPDANAIRWGTMYNFWFDADVAPIGSTASLGRFKPGAGAAVILGAVQAPAPSDCNNNSIPDDQDVAPGGGSQDCNSNTIPDECELDGNDCNSSQVPDDCELVGNDCNSNQVLDACELTGNDCNTNQIPDICEMAGNDCNSNGVFDACELVGNDCDGNLVPDDCQPDCDRDGTIDPCEGEPDCNANAVPDSCDVNGLAGGVTTYYSGTINLPILDNQTTTSIQSATAGGAVVDVNVQVDITHSYDGDLRLKLAHGATTVNLCMNRGGSGNNFNNTIFDDEAATAITSGSPPYAGTYRPEQLLSAFDGQLAGGNWTLTVQDTASQDTGTLISWRLFIETPTQPPVSQDVNANNIPDECECPTCGGDVNGDGYMDGGDVQYFTDALMGTFSPCADMNTSGPPLTQEDIDAFADALLNGSGPCP
ncbi:MAG TPA: proprotein convertase P-domain-containing protein [Phycisphaerae bacterium]|nr:proprotein convertase P-domain-containing protein [Phycisphaerae bacterium]